MFLPPCGGTNHRNGELLPRSGHRAAEPHPNLRPCLGVAPSPLRPPPPTACDLLRELRLRVLRSETLHWISLLKTIWSSLSRSTIPNSKTCNCSSLHVTLFFWNFLDTRDQLLALGIWISFDRRYNVDSSIDRAISLASDNSLTTLQLSVSRTTLLLIFLSCFCAFLTRRA